MCCRCLPAARSAAGACAKPSSRALFPSSGLSCSPSRRHPSRGRAGGLNGQTFGCRPTDAMPRLPCVMPGVVLRRSESRSPALEAGAGPVPLWPVSRCSTAFLPPRLWRMCVRTTTPAPSKLPGSVGTSGASHAQRPHKRTRCGDAPVAGELNVRGSASVVQSDGQIGCALVAAAWIEFASIWLVVGPMPS